MQSAYRIDRSYDWNYAHGPVLPEALPRVPATPTKRFLGLAVRSRIGVAAGLLLNSRWIEAYAALGYDILTYKTVRSRARRSHPMPNWVYVNGARRFPRGPGAACTTTLPAGEPFARSSSVSYGMPSRDPGVWTRDVARARKVLKRGQVLIVSVVASPRAGAPAAAMVDEFARLAGLAAAAGAQVVEANLSCPNVCSAEGDIFHDAALSGAIGKAMKRETGRVPVALKVGFIPQRAQLARLLEAVAGGADALTMVNGVPARVEDARGRPAFGKGRESAGILGRLVHAPSVRQVRAAVELIGARKLPLEVLGVGGVSQAADAADFFAAGACAVMLGSAPMYDPYLAIRMKASHPEW